MHPSTPQGRFWNPSRTTAPLGGYCAPFTAHGNCHLADGTPESPKERFLTSMSEAGRFRIEIGSRPSRKRWPERLLWSRRAAIRLNGREISCECKTVVTSPLPYSDFTFRAINQHGEQGATDPGRRARPHPQRRIMATGVCHSYAASRAVHLDAGGCGARQAGSERQLDF